MLDHYRYLSIFWKEQLPKEGCMRMFEKRGIRNKTKKQAATSAFDVLTRTNVCAKCYTSSGLYVQMLWGCLEETVGVSIPASGAGFLNLVFQSRTAMEELMPLFNIIMLWLIYPVSVWETWIQFPCLPEGFELQTTQSDLISKLRYFVGEEGSLHSFWVTQAKPRVKEAGCSAVW